MLPLQSLYFMNSKCTVSIHNHKPLAMKKQLDLRRKNLMNKLLLSSIFTLSLLFTTTAIAVSQPPKKPTTIAVYKPPKKPSKPKNPPSSNGARTGGCTGTTQTSLTALAPLAYVGQTVSMQPTFAWFVPDVQSREMELSIYEYTNGKAKLIHKMRSQSTPGIVHVSLAQEKVSLSVGQKYVWQIALLCNPNHPSEDLVVRAEIEVVPIPSRLTNALSQTTEPNKRAELYAEEGLWYDALGETLNNSTNKASTLKFLEQLSKLEEQEVSNTQEPSRQKELQQQVVQLQQIINIERQRR